MSGLLLDTHVALWLIADPERLGPKAKAALGEQPVWLSSVSLWEVGLKQQLGKLTVDGDLAEALKLAGIRELSLSWAHAGEYATFELPTKDPFDRMLVGQARSERLQFMTADRVILGAGLSFTIDARR